MIAYLQPQSIKEGVYPLTYRNDPRWRTRLIDTLTTNSAMMSEEEMLDLPVNLVVQDLIESLPLTQMGRSNFVEERCGAVHGCIADYALAAWQIDNFCATISIIWHGDT